jgi:hypothetical protein
MAKNVTTAWRTLRLSSPRMGLDEPKVRNKAKQVIEDIMASHDALSGDWCHQKGLKGWKRHRKTQYKKLK